MLVLVLSSAGPYWTFNCPELNLLLPSLLLKALCTDPMENTVSIVDDVTTFTARSDTRKCVYEALV
jgi:hypothetical protein